MWIGDMTSGLIENFHNFFLTLEDPPLLLIVFLSFLSLYLLCRQIITLKSRGLQKYNTWPCLRLSWFILCIYLNCFWLSATQILREQWRHVLLYNRITHYHSWFSSSQKIVFLVHILCQSFVHTRRKASMFLGCPSWPHLLTKTSWVSKTNSIIVLTTWSFISCQPHSPSVKSHESPHSKSLAPNSCKRASGEMSPRISHQL